jgi:HD-GYP domain-containing protein (c-di-GMP phosphodiesterase class II)
MGATAKSGSFRHLSQVLLTTLAVVGIPTLTVALLRASGLVTSVFVLFAVAIVLSLVISRVGASFWATRAGAGDTVFGDLMLWGWLRRRRQERQLESAVRLLGRRGGEGRASLSQGRRVRLLERLATTLEARDPDTHGHSRRVARHAAATAKRMGLSREQVRRVRTAAAVHDVGKIETPVEIMRKPGSLSDAEFAVIKRHPGVGAQMVAGLDDRNLTAIVRHHHERLDGTGYPDRLAGGEIPLGARIVAVADTFDAVTSLRPYRPAKRHKEALALLSAEAGTQLDPDVVHAFRSYYSGARLVAIWALLVNGCRQLALSLAGELRLGGVTLAAKAALATAATVAVGGLAVHSLHGGSDPAAAGSAVSGKAGPAAGSAPAAEATTGSPGTGGVDTGHPGHGARGDETRPVGPIVESGGGADHATSGATETPQPSGETEAAPTAVATEGSGGGEAPIRTTAPSVPTETTAAVTHPVTTVVETVTGTVESAVPPVQVPGVGELHVEVPKVSLPGLGGG